jgi:adenylate cyclase
LTSERVVRRLAAILAADVAGYSRLMGRDEHGTLTRLKAHRTERLEPTLARHGGRLVKLTGDGALVEFPSAVDALGAAIEFQQAMAEINRDQPKDTAIVFRIGLHLGDLIVDGDDLYGDGVNVAARLEAEAPAGGIVISGNVYDAVTGRLKATFHDLGELTLKNIERPVRAFRTQWDTVDWTATMSAAAPPAGSSPTGERLARPSLAVVPFDNLGGDAAMEAFCDGLSEDLITAISRFRWIRVVSRKSTFAYKGRSPDIRQVARELMVGYVLEGSVRRAGKRIRINAQLIDAFGNHVWARRYDREIVDPFDLQDEVIRDVIGSLDYVLWHALVRGEAGVGSPDPAKSPLRAAGWHIAQLTAVDNRLAFACCTRALESNPRSVAAYQYLALAHTGNLRCGWADNASEDVAAGVEAARKAVALSPADSLSHSLFATLLGSTHDWQNAVVSGRHALALDPNSVNTLGPVAALLSFAGDAREANDLLARVLDLAPAHYSRTIFAALTAFNWLRLGAPERGLPLAEESVQLKPEALCGHVAQAALLATIGRCDDARAALARARRYRPDLDRAVIHAIVPYSDPGDAERLSVALLDAGLD